MQAVSNQHSYDEIKPLPIGKEACPSLRKLVERVVLLVTITGFSTGFGVALGLSRLPISVITGACLGGVVGICIGLSICFFFYSPSKEVEYRIDLLKQMRGATGNGEALDLLRSLRENLFAYPFTSFIHAYDHHTLHRQLTLITENIDKSRTDAREAWDGFLEHLKRTPLTTRGGEQLEFRTDLEQQILSGKKISVERSALSSWSFTYRQDLEQIDEIARISFGKGEMVPSSLRQSLLQEGRPSGCFLARDPQSGSVLGYCWYFTDKGITYIRELARRPEAARLGVGLQLLYEVIRECRGKSLALVVREGHPFMHHLERIGFHPLQSIEKHFQHPPVENGIVMGMDWKKHFGLFKDN